MRSAPVVVDLIGPACVADGAAQVLGCSVLDVDGLVAAGRLIAPVTSDGVRVFPVWQFRDGRLDERYQPSVHALRERGPWAVAGWFRLANPDLNEMSPVDWVESGNDLSVLLRSAQMTAVEWR